MRKRAYWPGGRAQHCPIWRFVRKGEDWGGIPRGLAAGNRELIMKGVSEKQFLGFQGEFKKGNSDDDFTVWKRFPRKG